MNQSITNGEPGVCDGYCLGCGYRLRGLSRARCPECGRAYDPEDAGSFSRAAPAPWIVRWLGTPVGLPLRMIATFLLLMSLISVVPPGACGLLIVLGAWGWMIVGCVWLARLAAFLIVNFAREHTIPHRYRPVRPWLWPPLFGVLSVCVVAVGTWDNGRILFYLTRPALERFASEAMRQPENAALPDRWIGIYPATSIERIPYGVRFIVVGTGFLDRAGFAYSIRGEPPNRGEDYYKLIEDGWYIWRESF